MKSQNYIRLGLGLLLLIKGIATFAEPLLNGLAIHEDLGKEPFIAGLYSESLATNPAALLSNGEHRRMELRITSEHFSARRLNSMWIEGMAVNNSGAALTKHADNMVKFTSLVKRRLYAGDTLTIDGIPGEGTRVTVNGTVLGTIKAEDFFTLLLRTWIGPVPLSSDFRDGLLQAGEVDSELLARYNATTPTEKRVAVVKAWLAPKPEQTAAAEEPEPTPKPKPSTPKPTAPIAVAPPPPTLAQAPSLSSQEASASPTKQQQAAQKQPAHQQAAKPAQQDAKPKPATSAPAKPGTQQVALAKPLPQEVILDEEELEEEDDAPTFTAESLLSRQLYHSKLLKWTYQYLKYPQRAQKRGQEGSVRLSVVIDRDGNIKRFSTVQESRYALLNKEAENAISRANPFPPVPDDVSGEEFTFSLPIVFKIR